MPISYIHKAIFIHVPKTGGQSVSAMLGIPKGSKKHFYQEGLTHLTLPMVQDIIDVSDMYAFIFVRNPYDKIVSEYAWRMQNIRSKVFNEPTRNRMSFTDYMELLLSRWDNLVEPHREKAHVLPQVTFLEDGIDVYRYENFNEECIRLGKRLGINNNVPHVNKGTNIPAHTDRTIEITRELYAEDFETFGYDNLT